MNHATQRQPITMLSKCTEYFSETTFSMSTFNLFGKEGATYTNCVRRGRVALVSPGVITKLSHDIMVYGTHGCISGVSYVFTEGGCINRQIWLNLLVIGSN